MDGLNFKIRSNEKDFDYHLPNNERMVLEIENVNGELKISTQNNGLNLMESNDDYLSLYEHDYMPEKHKSSINDILKSKKEKTFKTHKVEDDQEELPQSRTDIINQYINKYSS